MTAAGRLANFTVKLSQFERRDDFNLQTLLIPSSTFIFLLVEGKNLLY
jgi:hypothetical protein